MAAPGDSALRDRIERRLRATAPGGDPLQAWISGLTPQQTTELRRHLPPSFARAAVLVPLIDRPEGLTVLLTRRASHLKNHPGQISFPGGRVEGGDRDHIDRWDRSHRVAAHLYQCCRP